MNLRTTFAAAAFAGAALVAGAASATSVGVISTTGGNDALSPLGFASPLDGYYGFDFLLSGPVTVTATSYGKEAANTNTFWLGTDTPLQTLTPTTTFAAGASVTYAFASAGVMSFGFRTIDPSSVESNVVNGSNPDPSISESGPNFFVHMESALVWWLFLDDQFFTGDDDNHDDMVVKLVFDGAPPGPLEPVPLPAAGLLLLGGLGGLAALKRRKKA